MGQNRMCERPNALLGVALSLIVLSACHGTNDRSTSPSEDEKSSGTAQQSLHSLGSESLPPLFRDVTADVGIDFVHRPYDDGHEYSLPRMIGSGAAFLDYDSDGSLDIYLLQNGGPESEYTNRLFRQTPNGFVDVTKGSGLDVAGYGMGVACGDVNNDGRVDVLLNEYGKSRLLLNQTSGVTPQFVDITASCGLENRLWGTSASFLDYDRDGWLDFVLVNYVNFDPTRWCADASGNQEFCGPDAFSGRVTQLFHNRGGADEVRFDNVTVTSGLAAKPGPGLGMFCADFDGDRWPDIFVANDGKPNHLWINQQDGTFKEEAMLRGISYNSMGKSEADMGVAIGDVDGNGLFDVFVTHLSEETHTLWSQEPRGIFTDRTATSGLTTAAWRGTGFGTVMADVNNDGTLDVLIANGRITRERGPLPPTIEGLDRFWVPYAQADQLLLNQNDGRFTDASLANEALSGRAAVSRGLACADFNNDGQLDLLITNVGSRPKLLQNVHASSAHWLTIRAIDPQLNRDAYGAEIHVEAGERRLVRYLNPGYSFLCSNDPRAQFGLGDIARVDVLRVIWPDGMEEAFEVASIDCEITVRRGEGTPVP